MIIYFSFILLLIILNKQYINELSELKMKIEKDKSIKYDINSKEFLIISLLLSEYLINISIINSIVSCEKNKLI